MVKVGFEFSHSIIKIFGVVQPIVVAHLVVETNPILVLELVVVYGFLDELNGQIVHHPVLLVGSP